MRSPVPPSDASADEAGSALDRHPDLRDADERTRSIVDHVVDGIITIDERGTIETFNRAAERIFSYGATEVIGRNVNVLMPEPYHSEHDRYVASYVATGVARIIGVGREVVGRRRDGGTFPMELAVSEFRTASGRHFTGIVRDITERKRLERELTERMEDLARADRQKDEFLAMLAHELRNPLAPLRNALHLLTLAGSDPSTVALARDVMSRQVEHLVRLVDDLLDVSRIVRGKIALKRDRVDLAEAARRAVETAQPAIETQRHALRLSLPPTAVWIDGDLVRIAQAIGNLLTNAAKYTPPGGRIALSVEARDDRAVVIVEDDGIGVPRELQERIFDLFVQADQSLARGQGGLGIGLTLVRQLVERHGGTVNVASEGPGKGSCFTIALPLACTPASTSVPRDAPRAATASGLRVLVVDDNVDAAKSTAIVLELSGMQVRIAHDGLAALEDARAWRPHVLLLDIGLPGLSGYEVARRLRAQPEFEGTPIVALTGYGQDSDRERSKAAGIDRHLTKPVEPDALVRLIAGLLPA